MKEIAINIACIILIACSSTEHKNNIISDNNNNTCSDTFTKALHIDTIYNLSLNNNDESNYIIPDLFILSNSEILKYQESKNYPFFTDKEKKCYLYFEPYTDGSVTLAILSRDQNIPKEYLEMLKSEGFNSKTKSLPIEIDRIETSIGININTKREEFIDLFGSPINTTKRNGIEILKWQFRMKESTNIKIDYRKLQPFIVNGLEFNIELQFKNNILMNLIYSYEVP